MLRSQEHRIQSGIQLVVDQCHLEFTLEIRDGPKPLDDNGTPLLPGKVCQQLVREHDLHIWNVRRHTPDELHALCRGKHGMFVDVEHHADDQPVKALGRALDDVQVPVRHRVKAAGIDRCLHARCAFRKIVTAVLPYL